MYSSSSLFANDSLAMLSLGVSEIQMHFKEFTQTNTDLRNIYMIFKDICIFIFSP